MGVDAEAEDVVVYAEEEAPVEALPMPSATIAAKWVMCLGIVQSPSNVSSVAERGICPLNVA